MLLIHLGLRDCALEKISSMSSTPASLSERRDHPTLGIVSMIGNLLLMVLISATVKHLAVGYPLNEILMFRFIFAALIFWIILLTNSGVPGLKTNRIGDHAIRSVSGIISLGLFFFAVSTIPIADATALVYAAPVFITVLSVFILGETIGIRRWLAVVAGFTGVLLIAQPGGVGWNIGVAAAIASAFTAALVATWLRRLSSSEKPATIGVYYNSLGMIVCTSWVVLSGSFILPANDWPVWIIFGIFCGGQQWLLTISFRYAEASLLAPFEYLAIVFAAIVGYLVWGEMPVLSTWCGALVIAASGLFIFNRKQQKQKQS